jgi:hypothetical protein
LPYASSGYQQKLNPGKKRNSTKREKTQKKYDLSYATCTAHGKLATFAVCHMHGTWQT